jgi:hypothetical protein
MSVKIEKSAIDSVLAEIEGRMNAFQEVIIRNLQAAGEEAVKKARGLVTAGGGGGGVMPPYTVQTGNLVSSVGYAVVADGKVVGMSPFQAVQGAVGKDGRPKGDGQAGAAAGMAYAKELAMRFTKGYALILVAGMHYASYVQEIHNRDVLVSASLVAEQLVGELQEKISQTR